MFQLFIYVYIYKLLYTNERKYIAIKLMLLWYGNKFGFSNKTLRYMISLIVIRFDNVNKSTEIINFMSISILYRLRLKHFFPMVLTYIIS